jgi:hypothetical protein
VPAPSGVYPPEQPGCDARDLLEGAVHGHGVAGAEALLPTSARKQGKRAPHPAKLAGQLRDAILATDVVFELFDHELLLGNNRLNEIANRDDAD